MTGPVLYATPCPDGFRGSQGSYHAEDCACEARGWVVEPQPIPMVPDPHCVANWPDAVNGGYDPSCCRFPKSCSVGSVPDPAWMALGEPCDCELIKGVRTRITDDMIAVPCECCIEGRRTVPIVMPCEHGDEGMLANGWHTIGDEMFRCDGWRRVGRRTVTLAPVLTADNGDIIASRSCDYVFVARSGNVHLFRSDQTHEILALDHARLSPGMVVAVPGEVETT